MKSLSCSPRAGHSLCDRPMSLPHSIITVWALMLACALQLHADPRTSGNYSITPETLDSGGGRGTSADYRMDASSGLIIGVSSAASPVEAHKAGFVAQLPDMVALQLSATPTSINEGTTSQLGATEILDDNTTNGVPASSVVWSVQSGAISGISTGGVANAANVYQDSSAVVQGACAGFARTLNMTVLNVNNDNFGSYAADGLDDAWQVQYFGLNSPNADPTVDADHDSQNNLFEYTTGTLPTDPNSRFFITIALVTGQPGQKNLNFYPTASGRTYTAQFSPDLINWQTLTSLTSRDNGTVRTVTDLNATGTRKFYRVLISRP